MNFKLMIFYVTKGNTVSVKQIFFLKAFKLSNAYTTKCGSPHSLSCFLSLIGM